MSGRIRSCRVAAWTGPFPPIPSGKKGGDFNNNNIFTYLFKFNFINILYILFNLESLNGQTRVLAKKTHKKKTKQQISQPQGEERWGGCK